MTENDPRDLISRWQAGDEQAAQEIVDRYANRLLALARSRFDSRLQQRVDPEDVTQSAFRSFFRRTALGQYEYRSENELWGLLAKLTINKLKTQQKFHHAQKRSLSAEVGQTAKEDDSALPFDGVTKEPTADDVVALEEILEAVLGSFDPLHREIIELRLAGGKPVEIAEDCGRSERSVRRVLLRFEQDLQAALHPAERDEANAEEE